MTTLNEKAKEYAQREFCQIGYCGGETPCLFNANLDYEEMCGIVHAAYDAYIAGVTEATRWRYVNVELPSLDVKILIKAIDGEVRTGSMINQHQFSFDGDSNSPHYTVRTNVKYCGGKADIVSWRPIETI